MAKGHRSQIKRERNANKDTRPSAKLSYARVSVQKACFVLDAIRGKDVQTALAILGPLWFHISFGVICSSSVKHVLGNLIGIALNL